ncbi:hypothetical protein ABBQ32_009017 [Trebouxia sp. C0010 RCD-2024]
MKAVAYLAGVLLRPVDARLGALNRYTSLTSRLAGHFRRSTSTLTSFSSRSEATEGLSMRSFSAWPNHRVVQVDSRNTEVYHMSSNGRSRLQVLILPGNPGSAGYYEAYIAALHAALHGQAEVHAVSHLGHASSKKARQYGNKAFSLQEQIDHKVAYIYQHMSQQQPIAIIGHSIGAYMALKVVKRLQAVTSASPDIAKVLAIFPFLQADLSTGQQTMMHALTKAPRFMGVIGAMLGLLPSKCKRWLVNWWGGGLDDYAEKATVGLLNYNTIMNGFFLGQTEFRDLAGPVDWKELQELGARLLIVSVVLCGLACDANNTLPRHLWYYGTCR